MFGGGSRRDEGPLVLNNTNGFAALDSLRKKKKSDKDRKSKGLSKSQTSQPKEPEPQVFWNPTPLNTKSWADVDDDDDDDYYATTAPPQAAWGLSEPPETKEMPGNEEESDSEEDILDEGDDEVEEEHDHEPEEVPVLPEPLASRPPDASASKEVDRQLSKKERKKKELAELEALLADFGVTKKQSNGQDESHDIAEEKRDEELNGEGEKKDSAPTESKNAKKKKKKEKASKEVKEQDKTSNSDATHGPGEAAGNEQTEEEPSAIDVKERLKKMTSMKKKKSGKEVDGAAKAAAQEAAARSARLAAAKKKEKSHYNQQPVR